MATATETRLITMPNVLPGPPRSRNGPSLDGAELAFSLDGKILAASSQRDGLICLLDTSSGKELSRLDGTTGYRTKAFAFSPDGKILATGLETGETLGASFLYGYGTWQRDGTFVASRRIVPKSAP